MDAPGDRNNESPSSHGGARSLQHISPQPDSLDDTLSLPFGVEMEYLFPNTTVSSVRHRDYAWDRMKEIQAALTAVNVSSEVFLSKTLSKVSNVSKWKIVREHTGFELVSPIYTSPEAIKPVLDAMRSIRVQTHVTQTNLHVSIDATNRTVDDIRNVYKNFISAETALDEIRDFPQRANHSAKSLSLRQQFQSVSEAYEKLDGCHEDFFCLWDTAQTFESPYFHLVDLRLDWKELEQNNDNSTTNETAADKDAKYNVWSERIEFRGQQSSLDTNFVSSWVWLMHNLVKSSFDGIVMPPQEQTVEEAWVALFHELIRDSKLGDYFEKRRSQLSTTQMEES